jgi:hypothetical protein
VNFFRHHVLKALLKTERVTEATVTISATRLESPPSWPQTALIWM